MKPIILKAFDDVGEFALQELRAEFQTVDLQSRDDLIVYVGNAKNLANIRSLASRVERPAIRRAIVLINNDKDACTGEIPLKNRPFYLIQTDLKQSRVKIRLFIEFLASNRVIDKMPPVQYLTEVKMDKINVEHSDDALTKTQDLISSVVENWYDIRLVKRVFLTIKAEGTADLLKIKEIMDAVFYVFDRNVVKVHIDIVNQIGLGKKMILEMAVI